MEKIKAGLEIHQQLDTHKLFCNCPSVLRSDEPDFTISRKLHAIAGETGEVDEAVKHEAGKDKEFIYQGYNDTTCLVEMDEEPPEMINPEALRIGLQVALLLNCEIFPVSQIMRKTVIDGSNTGGFQRTVLFANNGWIETSSGRVRIATVALEEDASRIIEQDSKKTIYRLDRLGIPLIEISTEADIVSAEQAKEAALHIGDILIRQDVNVSIDKHPRVEIKGFQDVKLFVSTIENEVKRQESNLKSKKNIEGEVRRANPDSTTSFLRPMPGAARMYPETDLPLLYISRDLVNEVKKNLPKLRADIKQELKSDGLNDEMINLVVSENRIDDFRELIQINKDGNLIVKLLILWPREFSKKEKIPEEKILGRVTLDVIESILHALNKKKIEKHDVQEVLFSYLRGKSIDQALELEKKDLNEVEEYVIKLIKEKPGLSVGGYMGLVMQHFHGKISGKEVMDVLKKHVK